MITSKQLEKENFVLVINSWFRSDLRKNNKCFYNNEDLLIFALLQKNTLIRNNQILFNLTWLYQQLNINNKNNYTKQKKIQEILIKFQENNLLICNENLKQINKNTLVTAKLNITEDFTKIYDYQFDKIFNSNYNIEEKRNLFALLCDISSRIDEKKYCYPDLKTLSQDIQISVKSIVKYLKILKEMQLIDYDNPGLKIKDNKITQANNIYVLCIGDYVNILSNVIEKRKIELINEKNKVIKNKKRSAERKNISSPSDIEEQREVTEENISLPSDFIKEYKKIKHKHKIDSFEKSKSGSRILTVGIVVEKTKSRVIIKNPDDGKIHLVNDWNMEEGNIFDYKKGDVVVVYGTKYGKDLSVERIKNYYTNKTKETEEKQQENVGKDRYILTSERNKIIEKYYKYTNLKEPKKKVNTAIKQLLKKGYTLKDIDKALEFAKKHNIKLNNAFGLHWVIIDEKFKEEQEKIVKEEIRKRAKEIEANLSEGVPYFECEEWKKKRREWEERRKQREKEAEEEFFRSLGISS